MDLALCKMCKEPIWNFLCVDCMGKDVRKVLPEGLLKDFDLFHRRIVESFHSFYDHTFCLKCRHENPVVVCPYCYVKEMLSLFSGKEPILAKKVARLIPYFRHPYRKEDARAITELHNGKTAYGMCDECGECSESLERRGNGWVCEGCRE
jgi:hypothetical protein